MIRFNIRKISYLRILSVIVLGAFCLTFAPDVFADDYFKKYKEGREYRRKARKKIKMPKGVTAQKLKTQDGERN